MVHNETVSHNKQLPTMTTTTVKNKCPFDKFCIDENCALNHSQKNFCKHNEKCEYYFCSFRHSERRPLCVEGLHCTCQLIHPKESDYCKSKETCFNEKCKFAHTRVWCTFKKNCTNYDCTSRHPKERRKCDNGSNCSNKKCKFLHPSASVSSSPPKVPCSLAIA